MPIDCHPSISRLVFGKGLSLHEIESTWSLNDVVAFNIMMDIEGYEQEDRARKAQKSQKKGRR
jgi:uncharacterized protein YaeQ